MNWFKFSQQEPLIISGPGVDSMINTIHQMLSLGAPVELDYQGGSGVSYPVFQNFANIPVGTPLEWEVVIRGMNALKIHKNTQLPSIGVDYETLKQQVVEDYNRVKNISGEQQPETQPNYVKFVEETQMGRFKKLIFNIPNLARYPRVKAAIRDEMNRRVREEGQQFYQVKMDNYGKEDNPVWMAFNRSREHLDGYAVDPSFIFVIEPQLREMGYDTTEMQQFVQEPEEVVRKISASLIGTTVVIDFNGFPGREVIDTAKEIGFRGRKEGLDWKWANLEPNPKLLSDFAEYMENNHYDVSELRNIIEQLPQVSEEEEIPQQDMDKINIQIRDVTGETGGRWHMAVKFMRRGTYEGETLKEILKYSFINWAKTLDDTEGDRTINKDTWESYVAGNMQEYVNFINSLHNRGFNAQPVADILKKLTEGGLVAPMDGIGFLDGYESPEQFGEQLNQYQLPFELYPEQKDAVARLYSHKSYLRGDETGVGKTVVGVLAADMRMKQSGGRGVVITKNAVQDQFAEEIANFLQLDINDKTQISFNPLDNARWTVLSYTNFSAPGVRGEAEPGTLSGRKQITDELVRQGVNGEIQCLLLDEAHTVKNGNPRNRDETGERKHRSNQTTFNVQDFSENVPFVWGLSATVVANKPIDVYNQLKAINHPLGKMSWNKFAVEFGAMRPGRYGLEEGTIEEQIEAVNKLKEYLFDQSAYEALSKKQIREDMPDQIVSQVPVPINAHRLWGKVRNRLGNYKNPDLEVSQMQAFRNEAAIEKVPSTCENAFKVLNDGKKVMIFTDYKDSLQSITGNIQHYLDQRGLGEQVVTIAGGMRKKTRKAAKDSFKDMNSNVKAIVINIIAGGTGLDFPNVTTDVFVNDFDWSVAADEQMLGRSYRINSEQDVNVTYSIAEDTPDEEYYERLSHKKKVADIIHKMSIEQDSLMQSGHRRKKSPQLDQLEKQLNKYKKEYVEMEEGDKDFNKRVTREIVRNVRQASQGNWFKRVYS